MKNSIYVPDNKINLSGWNLCDKLPDVFPIKKVHGLCFSHKGEILLISRNNNNGWTLPGGSHKLLETTVDTFTRETMEEARVKLFNLKLVGYRDKNNDPVFIDDNLGYRLMYSALISDIYTQKKDPSSNLIRERKFIDPRDLESYFYLDSSGYAIVQNAINNYRSFKEMFY